ncbi:hypothetical protein WISP_122335 [Willisornis vidua]|uniref:Uncharacterized protein n=1 Tax=Willisornis vidua TaxID=1566151 RepID=A0ABQ9CS40_9PASS|nr:hypothetical protein WISP_122335 [Willisornis vidua]
MNKSVGARAPFPGLKRDPPVLDPCRYWTHCELMGSSFIPGLKLHVKTTTDSLALNSHFFLATGNMEGEDDQGFHAITTTASCPFLVFIRQNDIMYMREKVNSKDNSVPEYT